MTILWRRCSIQGYPIMALVSYVPTDKAAESIRPRFANMEAKGHDVPNFLRTLAHSPDIMEAFIGLNGALNRTKLDPKLRELAYIKVSEINTCGYCMQHHKAGGRKAGLNDAQLS
jgi:AhpD family alkylhydroperoxidase